MVFHQLSPLQGSWLSRKSIYIKVPHLFVCGLLLPDHPVIVCHWNRITIDLLRLRRLTLLISSNTHIIHLTVGIPQIHPSSPSNPPQTLLFLRSQLQVDLPSINMDRHFYRRFVRRMRQWNRRPRLAQREQCTDECCPVHATLLHSRLILPLDHKCSEV